MSAEGLLIGKASKPWRVGRRLGSGACGSVHELDRPGGSKSSSMKYAVKITPSPATQAATSKGKKRKKTAAELNADLLFHEFILLQNFGNLRGFLVPDIPLPGMGPPSYGETNGYRFLVMERMSGPLESAVPILLEPHLKGSCPVADIALGDVATAMLNCIQALHDRGNLFVDVKSDNFMISNPSSARTGTKGEKLSSSNISRCIRLIDFGLVESFHDVSASSHRENMYPGAPLVGTPAYASINVMTGNTISRRDDLESLGYVISELIIQLASSYLNHNGKECGKTLKSLPWSKASSDKEVCAVKFREMDETKRSSSALFLNFKSVGVDEVMSNFFTAVRQLKYKEKPNYDELRNILTNLVVSLPMTKETSETAQRRRRHQPKHAARAKKPVVDVDETDKVPSSPKKHKLALSDRETKRSERCRTSKTARQGNYTNELRSLSNEENITCEIDVDDSKECHSSDSCEPNDDKSPQYRLKLQIIEGPHKGETVHFGADYPTTIVIGRDPQMSENSDVFTLASDPCVSSQHAKLVLHSKKNKIHSVRVTDLSSTNGTFINKSALPKGKSRQAFAGDELLMGDTVFQIIRG